MSTLHRLSRPAPPTIHRKAVSVAPTDAAGAIGQPLEDRLGVEPDLANAQAAWREDSPDWRLLATFGVNGSSWYSPVKGVVECVLAVTIGILALPVMLVAIVLVRLTSPGPVFYSQTRLGRRGRPFVIYKIRSMFHDCERLTGARWASPRDPRITRVGWYLRKLHVDELPQLLNVIKGEMALIGPRPERPEFVPQLERAIPCYALRLAVRPGLTGLAQIQLPPDTDLHSVRRKLAYDLHYVRNLTWWMDLRILAATPLHVLGMPYHWLRRLCGIPAPETVESSHRVLLTAKRLAKHASNGSPAQARSL